MDLSIPEAATLLGKSERQIRYMIKQETLKAKKVGGRWMIESEDLPINEGQRRAAESKLHRVREAVDQVLEPVAAAERATGPRRFSVRDLRAFKEGEAVLRQVVDKLGWENEAAQKLRLALRSLAQGCHAYHPPEKLARYTNAREQAASAVVDLLLGEDGEALSDRLEQDFLSALGGLIRSTERSGRRRRFDDFGRGGRSGR